uniref:Uncharacterized protein n=1 Tax=Ascaris lumbricoides TaxID=6252 RepID=A0A0M3IF73_ASCLU
MKSISGGVSASDMMSEFSRTMSGIRRLFIPSDFHDAQAHISKIFSGEFCLKTCGMEDIQYAAQKAAEMMAAMRICAIVLTVFTVLSMTLLTGVLFFYFLKKGFSIGRYHSVELPTMKSRPPDMLTLNSAVSSLSRSLVD